MANEDYFKKTSEVTSYIGQYDSTKSPSDLEIAQNTFNEIRRTGLSESQRDELEDIGKELDARLLQMNKLEATATEQP